MSDNVVELESNDIVKDNIEKLKQIFPDIVKDGSIDFDTLKTILGEEIETDKESYKFEWVGKQNCYKTIQTPSNGTLKYIEEDSLNPDNNENLIIEGDNLEVLKLLQTSYKEQIDIIYIDPPYNTGTDFIYPDNFETPIENYFEITGQKVNGEDTQSNKSKTGRKHTQWLNMIFTRLMLSKRLLKENGVVFISIDDVEFSNLKSMCDNEIFGEENYLGTIIRNTNSSKNQSKFLSISYDYTLVYCKDKNYLIELLGENGKWEVEKNNVKEYIKQINFLKKQKLTDDEITKELKELVKYPRFVDFVNYWNLDKHFKKRGVYRKGDLGGVKNGNMNPLLNPLTNEYDPVPPGGFRYTDDKLKKLIKEDRIHFHIDGSLPTIKRYLLENPNQRPKGIMSDDQRPDGTLLSQMNLEFDNPKQLEFMKRILGIFDKNSCVLDFFGGSGTTGQSVLELNKEDGGNRKFILIQLPEPIKEKKSNGKKDKNYQNGYRKISDLTISRIKQVINGYGKNPQPINGGFKVFKLDNSNYKINEKININKETEKEDIIKKLRSQFKSSTVHDQSLVKDYKESDIIYENIIKEGYNLNSKIELVEDLKPYEVYKITDSVKKDKKFYISFKKVDIDIKLKNEFMGISKDTLFICFDHDLSDSDKSNLSDTFLLKTM